MHQVAEEALGEENKLCSNKIWWNEEIEELVKQKKRKYLKRASPKTEEDRQEYKQLSRQVLQPCGRLPYAGAVTR